jgi:DnaJ-class molecular chaperone
MVARDLFENLGVARTATLEEIQRAVRRSRAAVHPDNRHSESFTAEERVAIRYCIDETSRILVHNRARRAYLQLLEHNKLPARHGGAGTPFRTIRSLIKAEMRGVRRPPLTPHTYPSSGYKFYNGSYQDLLKTHVEILLKQTV